MSNKRRVVAIMLPALFGAITLQCRPSDTDAATVANAKTQASAEAVIPQTKTSNIAGLRFVVAPAGNEVRYRIREQLVRVDLPNDATGAMGSCAETSCRGTSIQRSSLRQQLFAGSRSRYPPRDRIPST